MEEGTIEGRLTVWLSLKLPSGVSLERVLAQLTQVKGVYGVTSDER